MPLNCHRRLWEMAQNKDVYSAYVCKKQGNEPCVRHVWAGHLVEAAA
jgi:hypothetical protein